MDHQIPQQEIDATRKSIEENGFAIVACRPQVLSEAEKQAALETGHDFSPYPGSVGGTCRSCGRDVWIGPKSQKMVEMFGDDLYQLCMTCVVLTMSTMQDSERMVLNLGNKAHPQSN